MRIERAARFGIYGSIGFIAIWLLLFGLIREIQTGVYGGTSQGNVRILMILVVGTAVGMMFLFTLIGEYVDRELEARGLADSGE